MRKSLVCALFLIACNGTPPSPEIVSPESAIWPYITSVTIVNNPSTLQVGMRYQVKVHVEPGSDTTNGYGVEADVMQPALNLVNTYNTEVPITSGRDFWFTMTPTAPDSYSFGFHMRSGIRITGWHPPTVIAAWSPQAGVFGWVRDRSGAAIPGAYVQMGNLTTTTATDGKYQFLAPPAEVHTIFASKAGYSDVVALHVPPATGGIRVDLTMQPAFPLAGTGVSYLSYVDYAHGRALLHMVQIDTTQSDVSVQVPQNGSAKLTAKDVPGLATINGGFFRFGPPVVAQGYLYAGGVAYPTIPISPYNVPAPMLTIKGGTYAIMDTAANNITFTPNFDAAIQCGPWLVQNGILSPDSGGDLDKYWARTSVGVSGSFFYFLVADGEGCPGSAGATQRQLADIYHDVLHVPDAMMLDGGGSTQLAMASAAGMNWVNTMTGEDSEWSGTPGGDVMSFITARKKCVPKTCVQLSACGPIDDGCGHIIDCNLRCATGSICDGSRCVKCPTTTCQQP